MTQPHAVDQPIRVGVLGARGRMGSQVSKAIDAASDTELVAMADADEWIFEFADAGAQVVVDFTRPDVVMDNIRWCLDQDISMVVGTSGFDRQRLETLREWLSVKPEVGVIVAPNLAIGAVLMMQYAAKAARFYESAEVVELHHPEKVDAPSGTATRTAELIARAREDAGQRAASDATTTGLEGARGADIAGVRVHAVRLRGLVAHQEVLLGGVGETLTNRHDTYDRAAFMPGVLLAVRAVLQRPGLTVGLDPLLDEITP